MKLTGSAAAAALMLAVVSGQANAAGPYPLDQSGTVAAVAGGTVTNHFYTSDHGWVGFRTMDPITHLPINPGLVGMGPGSLHQSVLYSLTGSSVPCNPNVCFGQSSVPEVADIEFPTPYLPPSP